MNVAGAEVPNTQAATPGIRGWLLAFMLWFGVISPLWSAGFSVFALYWLERWNPNDAALMREENWDVLLLAVSFLRAGMRVAAAALMYFRRKAYSVWFALLVLWLSGPLLILGTWAWIEGEIDVPGFVRSVLIALAWSLFLLFSQRVKAIYGFRT
jgi:hypothetical protein